VLNSKHATASLVSVYAATNSPIISLAFRDYALPPKNKYEVKCPLDFTAGIIIAHLQSPQLSERFVKGATKIFVDSII